MARSILARTLGADGKSGGRIGGQLATASALAELGARLIEIHGQHGSLRLLEQETQTAFLDRAAGDAHLGALAAYRETYARLRDVRAAAADLEEASRERERELDLLAYQAGEIEAVGPRPGETPELEAEAGRLGHVERLLALASAVEAEVAGDGAAAETLASAAHGLGEMADLDPAAAELAARSAGLAAEAAELAHDVRIYRESLDRRPRASRGGQGQDRGAEGAAAQVRRHRRRRARVPAGGLGSPGRPVVGGRALGGAAAGARRAGGARRRVRPRTCRRAEPRPRPRSATS